MTPPSPYDGDTSPDSLGRKRLLRHGPERMGVRQVPRLPPARVARAGDKLALGQRGVHVGEGGDLAGRDAAGDVDRLEFPWMIEAGGRGHFSQLVQGRVVV